MLVGKLSDFVSDGHSVELGEALGHDGFVGRVYSTSVDVQNLVDFGYEACGVVGEPFSQAGIGLFQVVVVDLKRLVVFLAHFLEATAVDELSFGVELIEEFDELTFDVSFDFLQTEPLFKTGSFILRIDYHLIVLLIVLLIELEFIELPLFSLPHMYLILFEILLNIILFKH